MQQELSVDALGNLIEYIKPLSGLIVYLLGRKLYDRFVSAKIDKTSMEAEQIRQEIEFKYSTQVKKWLSDLEEIKDRHDLVIEKKDAKIHELQELQLESLKEITSLNLKLGQCGRAHRRLFTKLEIPYWECNSEGQLEYANGAWLKLFGLEEEDAIGDGWLKSVPESERQQFLVEWYSKVVDESDGVFVFHIENPITKEVTPVEAIYAVKFNALSQVYKIIGVTLKIDEKKLD